METKIANGFFCHIPSHTANHAKGPMKKKDVNVIFLTYFTWHTLHFNSPPNQIFNLENSAPHSLHTFFMAMVNNNWLNKIDLPSAKRPSGLP
ncbi:hypothetical protein [Delftia tsuruhatensis]|uniref:hypothetical protein n=1 Tax=Delftia tsuruhatensis TaxID=180282 RepID=UPI001F481D32|nr:hypothetical protein [Delftia tsuruhatensis]